MKYNPEQEITIDNRKLYVITCANYEGKEYIYAQEIDEEEDDLKMNYFIYEVGEKDILVEDSELLTNLFKVFEEKLKEEM